MSVASLQTPLSPVKKTFEEVAKTFALPNVLPRDTDALQTLLVAQQVAQAMREEAQTIRDEAHAYVIRRFCRSKHKRQSGPCMISAKV